MSSTWRLAQISLALAAVGLAFSTPPLGAAAPPPGRPDHRFGQAGRVIRDFGTEATPGRVFGAIAGPRGTALVLQPGRVGVAVARYLPDGQLDRSFGRNGVALDPRTNFYLEGHLAPGPGGTIVASSSEAITRFTAAGKVDASYGHEGSLRRDYSQVSIGLATNVPLPNGATIVVGPRITVKGPLGIVAVRYGPDGRIDPAYGKDGRGFAPLPNNYAPVGAVALQAGGLLIASPGEEEDELFLTRLNADGSLDRGFGTHGRTAVRGLGGPPVGLVQQSDRSIVVATAGNRFVRFKPTGERDPGFGRRGVVVGPAPRATLRALIQTPDGDLVGVGASRDDDGPNASTSFVVERLSAEGLPAPGFGAGAGYVTAALGAGLRTGARAAVLLPGGRLLLAGQAADPNGSSFGAKIALVAVEADGTPATDFGAGGARVTDAVSPSADAVTDLLVEPGGAVDAVGHAHGQVAALRFSRGGALDSSFADRGTHLFPSTGEWEIRSGASLASLPDGNLIVGPGSSGPPGIFRLRPNGDLDPRLGADGQAGAEVFAETLGVAAGGRQVVALGAAPSYARVLARLGPQGALDRSFGQGGRLRLSHTGEAGYEAPLAQGPGGVLAALAGPGTPVELTAGGQRIGQVDAAISRRWRRGGVPENVVDLAFDGRRLLVLGTRGRGLALIRFLADGRPDPGFGRGGLRLLRPGARFHPGRLAVEPDGQVIVAGVSLRSKSANGREPGRATVIRFHRDGSLDRTFGGDGIFRERGPRAVRVAAIGLGPGTVTVGGAAVGQGSTDLRMFLLRVGR
jgi:uncharacterized delta-60 repeat protein